MISLFLCFVFILNKPLHCPHLFGFLTSLFWTRRIRQPLVFIQWWCVCLTQIGNPNFRAILFLEQQLDPSSLCPDLSPVSFVVLVISGRIFVSDLKLHKFKNVACVQSLPQFQSPQHPLFQMLLIVAPALLRMERECMSYKIWGGWFFLIQLW